MPHDVTLIAMLAAAFVLAFVFGFIANKLRLPPLVGYLVAGIAMGPHTPGFIADTGMAAQLAEIGVILLMFGVGLHFSLSDLLAVRRIAIPGAVAQIVVSTAAGAAMAMLWGWTGGPALIMGLSLSVASTVVLLKALEQRSAIATPNGRVAVGWLIVEDLAMVLVLVLLPALAEVLGGTATNGAKEGGASVAAALGLTLLKVTAFGAVALGLGPRVMPWLLRQAARTGSRELFTLAILALSIGIAFGAAKLFGVSFALGAFFAGMVLSESDLSHKAAANSLPLQDAFAVLFFVSIGMLFDPTILWREPLMLAGVLAMVLVGKSLISFAVVFVLRYPISTALAVSAALAQIGEFSFILATLGISYGIFPAEGLSLVVAAALVSITLNPLAFTAMDRALAWLRSRPDAYERFELRFGAQYGRLQEMLERSRLAAEEKAAAHRTLSPQELVERFPLFAPLTPEQREVVLLHMTPHTASPGDVIMRKGEIADAAYLLSSGAAEVQFGRRRIRIGPGEFVGEMALLSGQPRSADVVSLDYTKFLMLTRSDFAEILRRYPDIRAHVVGVATKRDEMNREPTVLFPATGAAASPTRREVKDIER
ncbi:MAG TPA: cation:proton antiporter [Casimicrobiaceae bacterium]|nr:cation:proton antiporter [Casimicrobiaceae bacterium]